MNNQLAIGAAGGSLASLVLRILADPLPVPFDPIPYRFEEPPQTGWHLDCGSFVLGIGCGLVAGPVLEFIWLLRQWLLFVIRRQFQAVATTQWPLYREGH